MRHSLSFFRSRINVFNEGESLNIKRKGDKKMKGYMLSGSFYECYDDCSAMTDGHEFNEIYGVYTTLEAAKKDLRRAVKQVESIGNYSDYSGHIEIQEFDIDEYHEETGYQYICGVTIKLGKEVEA